MAAWIEVNLSPVWRAGADAREDSERAWLEFTGFKMRNWHKTGVYGEAWLSGNRVQHGIEEGLWIGNDDDLLFRRLYLVAESAVVFLTSRSRFAVKNVSVRQCTVCFFITQFRFVHCLNNHKFVRFGIYANKFVCHHDRSECSCSQWIQLDQQLWINTELERNWFF